MNHSENEEEIARLEFKGVLNQEPSPEELEVYYSENILPAYGITDKPIWERHVKTNPDNFLHLFTIDDTHYALAFDDYPSGFSVGGEAAITAVTTKNGTEILAVSSPYDKYVENAFGYFKLFKVIDNAQFISLVEYLENEYKKLLDEWHEESRHVIYASRDILRLVETASANHDMAALYSLENLVDALVYLNAVDNNIDLEKIKEYIKILHDAEFGYEIYSEKQKEQVADAIYRTLSYEVNQSIKYIEYDAKNLSDLVVLVFAMYAKKNLDSTAGISVSLLLDGDSINYPRDHFMNEELKQYFALNPYISENNIEQNMPAKLGDYELVAGSVTTQKIFRRELEYISF